MYSISFNYVGKGSASKTLAAFDIGMGNCKHSEKLLTSGYVNLYEWHFMYVCEEQFINSLLHMFDFWHIGTNTDSVLPW